MNKFLSFENNIKKAPWSYYVILILEAFLGTYGLGYIMSLSKERVLSGSFLSVFIFAGILVFLNWTHKNVKASLDMKERKRRNCWSVITAFIFSVLLVFGYQLENLKMSEGGFKGKFHILIMAFCLTFFIYPFVNLVYMAAERVRDGVGFKEASVNLKKTFFISWIVIFLAYIPAFLAYYPIVMSYDFHAQVLMSERGYIWFSQHHPQIHTFQISCFYNLGKAIGSPQTGMAFMAIFHMLVMSVCMAYAVVVVSKLIKHKLTPYIMTAIFAIYPVNAVLTVSTTKDTMFTALFLLFFCTVFDRFVFADSQKKKILMDVAVVLSGIIMSLYRMNASYAVVAASVVLVLFVPKKQKLLILAMGILIFGGFKASYEGIRAGLGTQIGKEPIEMYSVIIQAFARVGHYHANDMDDETRAMINRYVPEECWVEYNPQLSDPCKASAGFVYWENWKPDMGAVITTFFKLFAKYPNEFIDSFLETNRGYWFIDDTSFANCLGEGLEGRMGLVYTYNSSYSPGEVEEILHESKWPWMENIYENIVSANAFMNWPVLSLFFKTSFYCIVLVWLFFINIYIKDYKALGLLVLPEVYFCSLLLGPIVQVRYVFPLMVIIPLFIGLAFYGRSKKNESSEIKA